MQYGDTHEGGAEVMTLIDTIEVSTECSSGVHYTTLHYLPTYIISTLPHPL